jgi:hypothetical protein
MMADVWVVTGARTMLIPDPRVAEVVRLLSDMPDDLDSWDADEMMMELEDDFGIETVRLALRFIEASRSRQQSGRPAMWDRELDS